MGQVQHMVRRRLPLQLWLLKRFLEAGNTDNQSQTQGQDACRDRRTPVSRAGIAGDHRPDKQAPARDSIQATQRTNDHQNHFHRLVLRAEKTSIFTARAAKWD